MAQEIAITAVHHSEAVADEPHGGVAQGRGFPRIGGDAGHTKHHLGDVAIGRAEGAAIEGLQHVAESPAALRREPRVGGRWRRMQRAPETRDGGQPFGRIGVERDKCCEGLSGGGAREHHDMNCGRTEAVDNMKPVRAMPRGALVKCY